MKFLIFSLIITVVSARNGQPLPGYVCPQEDIDRTGCRGPKDCLYPNPADCHSFIQCNDAGLAYEMPCAPIDLVYNDTIKECDWESNTPCRPTTPKPRTTRVPTTEPLTTEPPTTETPTTEPPTTEPPTTEPPTTEPPTTEPPTTEPPTTQPPTTQPPTTQPPTTQPPTTQPPTTQPPTTQPPTTQPPTTQPPTTQPPTTQPPTTQPPTTQPPTTQPPTTEPPTTRTPTTLEPTTQTTPKPTSGPFVCSVEDIARTQCKGPIDCLYPNPESCTTFIQCTVNADERTGTPVVMPCAADLEWNDNTKRCDYKNQSTCPRH
ncbi:salivary glue protein Sgs-3-like [Oppia nitens]|uniref:salivary glue protein Sgs-3-like n=1 Tax=Oppia nitens TaxID=1686743 RepID=UPI0023D9EFC1|nr:salivary glue protein Sgs-3-like [Oppia nitens]